MSIRSDRKSALEQLRLATGELFGAERRLRGREQQQPRELTLSQLRALWILSQEDEVTAGGLAKSADLNPASVTAMLDQLEATGIVARRRDEEDRRVCMVSLTPTGRAILDERNAQWRSLWETRFKDTAAEDLTGALGVIRAITAMLEEL